MTIHVLTEAYNDYDQHGQYFIHAWSGKPERTELSLHVHPSTDLDWLLAGGGRRDSEYHWYNLVGVE